MGVFDKLKSELESKNYSAVAVFLCKATEGNERAKRNLFFWTKMVAKTDDEVILNTVFDMWKKKNTGLGRLMESGGRLNENRLKRVIMESINEVLDGELDDDDVVTVYHLCDRRTAIEAMNGNVSAMVSSGGTRFPGKILATLEPREIRGVYGNTMLELQVPASAVNNVQHSRHDGDYCAIDPSDIYKVSIYR